MVKSSLVVNDDGRKPTILMAIAIGVIVYLALTEESAKASTVTVAAGDTAPVSMQSLPKQDFCSEEEARVSVTPRPPMSNAAFLAPNLLTDGKKVYVETVSEKIVGASYKTIVMPDAVKNLIVEVNPTTWPSKVIPSQVRRQGPSFGYIGFHPFAAKETKKFCENAEDRCFIFPALVWPRGGVVKMVSKDPSEGDTGCRRPALLGVPNPRDDSCSKYDAKLVSVFPLADLLEIMPAEATIHRLILSKLRGWELEALASVAPHSYRLASAEIQCQDLVENDPNLFYPTATRCSQLIGCAQAWGFASAGCWREGGTGEGARALMTCFLTNEKTPEGRSALASNPYKKKVFAPLNHAAKDDAVCPARLKKSFMSVVG